jgi:hypothetical protein
VVIPEARGEPEPDAAVVLRPATVMDKPFTKDVSCVVEVAGTSLIRDRTTKLRHNARGGIAQYIILDLADRAVEEYLNPQPAAGVYSEPIVHTSGAILRLHLVGYERLEVSLADLYRPLNNGSARAAEIGGRPMECQGDGRGSEARRFVPA